MAVCSEYPIRESENLCVSVMEVISLFWSQKPWSPWSLSGKRKSAPAMGRQQQ